MEAVLSIVGGILMAIVMYYACNKINEKEPKLELDPIMHAALAFLIGVFGMCLSAGYIMWKSYKVSKK